jgi:hypothetical protein
LFDQALDLLEEQHGLVQKHFGTRSDKVST